jgi:hypothetical protein
LAAVSLAERPVISMRGSSRSAGWMTTSAINSRSAAAISLPPSTERRLSVLARSSIEAR